MDCDLDEVSGQMVLPIPDSRLLRAGATPKGSVAQHHRGRLPPIASPPGFSGRFLSAARRSPARELGTFLSRSLARAVWYRVSSQRSIAR